MIYVSGIDVKGGVGRVKLSRPSSRRLYTHLMEGFVAGGRAHYSYPQLKLAKVDIEKNVQVAADYEITRLPTVIGFRRGKAVSSLIGAQVLLLMTHLFEFFFISALVRFGLRFRKSR